MRYTENIKKLVKKSYLKNLHVPTSAEMDERILGDALAAMDESKKARPALAGPNIWRIIMKSRITKLAAAAAIAVGVLLSMSYGVVKIVKIYTLRFDSRRVNEDGSVTRTTEEVTLSGDFANEEEAARVWRETRELKKAGKYERTFRREIERNGVKRRIYIYRYTLSNGRVVTFAEQERVE